MRIDDWLITIVIVLVVISAIYLKRRFFK